MSNYIATKEHIWYYYILAPNYKTKCKFCESELCYAKFDVFKKHIKKNHREIWNYETREREKSDIYYNFFKYSSKLLLKCTICNKEISRNERKRYHLFSSHTKQERREHRLLSWPRKYFTQNTYFTVQCNVETCREIVPIKISNHIHNHINEKHPDKLKNTQETHDTAGPSQRA